MSFWWMQLRRVFVGVILLTIFGSFMGLILTQAFAARVAIGCVVVFVAWVAGTAYEMS